MSLPNSLILRAGPTAMATIRRDGLHPAQVAVVPGAAGGPKALGILGLDTALFGEWLPRAPRSRDLIGASIGSWRFAAVCRGDILAALKDFGDIYCGQRYPPRPSAQLVSESAHNNTRQLLGGREDAVLSHPHYRLHVIATRGLDVLARQSRFGTPAGFALAAMVNALGRRHLRHLAERMWFHDPRGVPAFLAAPGEASHSFDSFRTTSTPLNAANLHPALWASAAIPTVMLGVSRRSPMHHPAPIGTVASLTTICTSPTTAPMALRCIRISPTASSRAGSTSRCRGGVRAVNGWITCCWSRPRRHTSRHCRIESFPIAATSNALNTMAMPASVTGGRRWPKAIAWVKNSFACVTGVKLARGCCRYRKRLINAPAWVGRTVAVYTRSRPGFCKNSSIDESFQPFSPGKADVSLFFCASMTASDGCGHRRSEAP